MEYLMVGDEYKERWDELVEHPLQSWGWGEFRKTRQEISRLGRLEKGKLTKAFLIIWTPIKYTRFCFGYVPMGVMPDQNDINQLIELARSKKAIGIRMEPKVAVSNLTEKQRQLIGGLPKGRNIFKKSTFIMDLNLSEDELLKRMHPKGRYNIKVAEKHGVTVEKNNSNEAFESYLDLMFSGTAKRQGIYSHSVGYHRSLWKVLNGLGLADLWIAKYKGEILTSDIIFKFHKSIYYAYGASALNHKEVMSPTLLLWKIVQWGKKENYINFDLWGAEEGKGFSRFKEQFGPERIEYVGSLDVPVNKLLYVGFRISEEVRWKILRALK